MAALLKDAQLGAKVVREVGMLHSADVIQADVQEAAQLKLHAVAALVLEGLARDLHDERAERGVARVGEVAPEVGRLGRGVSRGAVLHAVVGPDRADDAAAALAQGVLEDGANHIGAGGLALGARDAHDGQRQVWPGEGLGRDERHGAAHVARDDGRAARSGLRQLVGALGLADVGDGAGLDGRGEVAALEGAALAEEDVARAHEARVAGGAGHGNVAAGRRGARQHAGLLEKLAQGKQGGGGTSHSRISLGSCGHRARGFNLSSLANSGYGL